MPTYKRAKAVAKGMGSAYNIYFDDKYRCFRVMKPTDIHRTDLHRHPENYTKVS